MKLDIVAGGIGEKQHGRDYGGRGDSYEQESGSAWTRGGARLRGTYGFECPG
jgi:hypothetical protein